MAGNRTVIVAIAAWISGLIARYGYNIDPNIIADFWINVFPLIMVVMRSISKTPIGKST